LFTKVKEIFELIGHRVQRLLSQNISTQASNVDSVGWPSLGHAKASGFADKKMDLPTVFQKKTQANKIEYFRFKRSFIHI
jgi:hypothetical protein